MGPRSLCLVVTLIACGLAGCRDDETETETEIEEGSGGRGGRGGGGGGTGSLPVPATLTGRWAGTLSCEGTARAGGESETRSGTTELALAIGEDRSITLPWGDSTGAQGTVTLRSGDRGVMIGPATIDVTDQRHDATSYTIVLATRNGSTLLTQTLSMRLAPGGLDYTEQAAATTPTGTLSVRCSGLLRAGAMRSAAPAGPGLAAAPLLMR